MVDIHLNKKLSKLSETGDLRRHHAHYDGIVMECADVNLSMGICTPLACVISQNRL